MRATEVRIHGVNKAFSEAAALSDIDLTVREGELLALLGPSGSGKTTLLRVIAGLEIPDSGRIFFGADDVTDRPVQQRGIGFVFQHYALFRHLSVFDNIAYGPRSRPRARRPSEADLRQRVHELLALVQLEGLDRRFPAQLSGGQRQRVALARALAIEPRVLLLDEPFGALDAQVRKDLRRWLRAIHRETGQTTIFVTHDQDEALELADRVAILNGGRLEQVASADDVYDAPASAFVMSFIGESSAVPVRISGGRVLFGDRALPVPAAGIRDGEADLFVRPGDLSVCDPGSGDLHGRVVGLRRVGMTRRADIRLAGTETDAELDSSGRDLTLGEDIALSIEAGRVFPR
ncbi:sulfate/molybdate ABC transporter ATP-binding protein [Enterovirga rhinocerotis]|uniref:Sulfate transport system ATP-binding protein n=1 Tax=Enterovirga rhinocerotis TaxID=1339210 RepID=A0A4R7C947_9HYPH|nr:sulfate/molybdate ABC transporter ATP-binding protein [Enterovirga rhinocerotis]TDR94542.1 sulfate transport system ATP-binding protein [Enterovirga rhinocerotis]